MTNTDTLMAGKTCLVTGANAGIGRATALGLARMGADLVMVCRSRERGDEALNFIKGETGNDSVRLLPADLSSLSSIRRLAAEVKTECSRLHLLINNAGVVMQARRHSENGFEMQFAVNFLGPFLLTNLLLDLLVASAPARVVNVSAAYHAESPPVDLEDLQMERQPYDSREVYARTKLAAMMFIYELARRLEGSGVTANCIHPGVIETRLMREFTTGLNPFPKERIARLKSITESPEQAARAIIDLATSPEVEGITGRYFEKLKAVPSSPASYDREAARRLWELAEEMTGLRTPAS